RGSPTARSRPGSSSPTARWRRTSPTCSTSSGSARGPSSPAGSSSREIRGALRVSADVARQGRRIGCGSMTGLTLFLVEQRLRIPDSELTLLQAALIDASLRLTARGEFVRYLRSTYLPGPGRLLSQFEALNPEVVRIVCESSQAPLTSLDAAV